MAEMRHWVTYQLPDGTTRTDNADVPGWQLPPGAVVVKDETVPFTGPVTQSGGGIPGGLAGGAEQLGIGNQFKFMENVGNPLDLVKQAYNAYQGAVAKPTDLSAAKGGLEETKGAGSTFAGDYANAQPRTAP